MISIHYGHAYKIVEKGNLNLNLNLNQSAKSSQCKKDNAQP